MRKICAALIVMALALSGMYVVSAQEITSPGEITIDGSVEVEHSSFKVIVPSSLPMIADSEGNITAASNAEIINRSSKSVKITSLNITAKQGSDWTLVNDVPSDVRGANEFTFSTSLNINDTIQANDVLPFTYDAQLSPITEGTTSIDLVTMTVTIDWEE